MKEGAVRSGRGGGRSTRGRLVRSAVWLVASLAAIALAFTVVGFEDVATAVAEADRTLVAAVGATTIAVLVVRGLALWVALSVLERPVGFARALAVYGAATFVNTVAPSGQAGGAPVSGLLVAHAADADYEVGVAAMVSLGALGNLMIGVFGAVGVGYLLATAAPGGLIVRLAAAGLALFALGLLAVWLLVRSRRRVAALAVSALVRLSRLPGRLAPGREPPARADVERRVAAFGLALARLLAGGRRSSALLVGLMGLAHALSVAALWLAFVALGHPVPVGVLLAIVPAAVLAAVVPLPGGLGGVDLALVGLLASATDAPAAAAAGAVLIYRAAAYWPRIVVGGVLAAAMLSFWRDS